MRTLFSHFRNEEYLLPFWLRHHRDIFDHGVLIDHHSTDNSCKIIRELVPDWEIVTTSLKNFDLLLNDSEIMTHENRFGGWKICLTITEFLCAASLEAVEARVEKEDFAGAHGRGVIMVEPEQSGLPPPDSKKSLVAQRTFGHFEDEKSWGGFLRRHGFDFIKPVYRPKRPTRLRIRPYVFWRKGVLMERSRLYHKMEHGTYFMGRHETYQKKIFAPPQDDFLVLYYCFSPNTPQMRQRAAKISHRLPPGIRTLVGQKYHHVQREQDPTYFDKERELLASHSRDLSQNKVFARNTAPWTCISSSAR